MKVRQKKKGGKAVKPYDKNVYKIANIEWSYMMIFGQLIIEYVA